MLFWHSCESRPAKTAVSHLCRRRGHYSKMCHNAAGRSRQSLKNHHRQQNQAPVKPGRRVNVIYRESDSYPDSEDDDRFYVGHISHSQSKDYDCKVEITVAGNVCMFEIDSSADKTVAPPSQQQPDYPLLPTDFILEGHGGNKLHCLGSMQNLPMCYKGRMLHQKVYYI